MGYVKKLARGEYKITDKFLEILLQQDNKMVFENKLKLKGL
jgi:predicted transcriptional regulator